jgi:LPXTG-motif cell wall-anchored protein
MELKTILTIGLCLFIVGGLVFLRLKKKRNKEKRIWISES